MQRLRVAVAIVIDVFVIPPRVQTILAARRVPCVLHPGALLRPALRFSFSPPTRAQAAAAARTRSPVAEVTRQGLGGRRAVLKWQRRLCGSFFYKLCI